LSERNVRRAHQRGALENGWLQARFSFCFGDYQDPNHTHWGSLRALNEDRVAAGRGFAWHGHRDIESLTYPIEGRIHHTDSLGNDYVFGPGELHRMTAGSGIEHAEMNASSVDAERHLQIWLYPQARGLAPGCERVRIDAAGARETWQLIASPDGRDGSATVQQRALLFVGRPARGSALGYGLAAHRLGYLHVVAGALSVDPGLQLRSGDGLRFTHHEALELVAEADGTEVLLFDL